MNKPEKIIYSIIIPVFNSEKSLNELFDRIEKVFFQLSKSFEVIFAVFVRYRFSFINGSALTR